MSLTYYCMQKISTKAHYNTECSTYICLIIRFTADQHVVCSLFITYSNLFAYLYKCFCVDTLRMYCNHHYFGYYVYLEGLYGTYYLYFSPRHLYLQYYNQGIPTLLFFNFIFSIFTLRNI
uniref:PE11R n=1 Tax=African swine fever virus TaxID=10497 RepID=A0A6G7KU02_ASF